MAKWTGKLKGISNSTMLSSAQWDEIRDAIEEFAPEIRRGGLEQAVEIVRRRVSVNSTLLQNLSTKYQIWKSKE